MDIPRFLLQAICLTASICIAGNAFAVESFTVPKGKSIDVKYQRHRSEVSHIKVEFRKAGAVDWQTIADVLSSQRTWCTRRR
jgi:hypothetical protein